MGASLVGDRPAGSDTGDTAGAQRYNERPSRAALAQGSGLSLSIRTYAAFGLLAGATRLLFVRPTPINWDAVQFELALSHFDLHAHQPHPPGYILYVFAGRLLDILVGQPGVSLALLSVLASAVAVPLVVWMAMRIFSDAGVAMGAALMLAASPLALYYGSVGLTYMPEMAFSLGVAGLAWKLRHSPRATTAALLGLCLGLAGGVRQTSLPVLLPVCLWALLGTRGEGRSSGRPAFHVSRFTFYAPSIFAVTLILACALWLVPLLYLSGGVEAYLRESALLARRASAGTSLLAGPEGVGYNLVFLAVAVGVGLAFALVPLGLWATRLLRFTLAREPHRFFLWWILPSVVLFALSHTGQYGYTLVILPPLLVLSSLCVRVLVDSMKPKIQSPKDKVARDHVSRFTFHASSLALGACASLALLSAAYFTLAQGPVTASNIVGNDQYWRAVQREMGQYVPGETVLLTSTEWGGPFRAAGYLLPVFHIYATGKDEQQTFGWLYSAYGGRSSYALPHSPANSYLALPQGVHMLVAMDADTAERLGGVENVESSQVSLPGGPPLYILRSYAPIAGIEIEQQRLRPTYERAAKP